MGAKKFDNPLLDKELINAFVDSVQKTLEMMGNISITAKKAYVQKGLTSTGDVAGLIGMVAGGMKGNITISFKKQAIFKILESMLGEEYQEIDDEVADAVGEITNQIYGSAKTTLNELGYGFEMAIPTVIKGDFQISSYHQGASLVIPFDVGETSEEMYVEITVEA